MQIESNGENELTIIGNIKSIEDSLEIKNAINALQKNGAKNILLRIIDSFSITSTVIGHLMKLVNLDKITISIVVGDHRLYQLLDELSLVQPFNVRLVESER
jgi:hypothetical protein